MGRVRIHCYGCGTTLRVAEQRTVIDLRNARWAIAHGETYCASCAQARGLAIADPPQEQSTATETSDLASALPAVSGSRQLIVVLFRLLAVGAALFSLAVLIAAAKAIARNSTGISGSEVIGVTALVAVAGWFPLAIWRGGDLLARLGMMTTCTACGGPVAVVKRRCGCGQRRRGQENRYRLALRPAGMWPVRYAPVGFAVSIGILIVLGAALWILNLHPSALLSVMLVDITLVGVALSLARRSAPPKPWQFGLRETPIRLGARTALLAYGALVVANAVYLTLFGPFTSGKTTFIAKAEPAGLIIAAVILAPLAEEFFFRGFVYGTLRRRISVSNAALVTTAMFVVAHWLSGYPGWALVPIAFISVAVCLTYEVTGSIWPCVAIHAANNASLFASPAVGALTLCAIVVAFVAVFLSRDSERSGSQRWLVPGFAGAASVAVLVMAGVLNNPPQSPLAQAASNNGYLQPSGFSSPGEEPAQGQWVANVTTTSSIGYGNLSARIKPFRITRDCDYGGDCPLAITVEPPGEPPTTAELVRESYGWQATFPPSLFQCGSTASGQAIDWNQYTTMVMRFTAGGVEAVANERKFSYAPACGYGTATEVWVAKLQGA